MRRQAWFTRRFVVGSVAMKSRFFVIGLAAMVGACSSPLAIPRPPSFQAMTTQDVDWSRLANRTASRFVSTFGTSRPVVYVAPGPTDMPFAGAFRKHLERELLERGIRVQQSALGATALRFEVQPYWYRSKDKKYPAEYASFWTTAGALGAQARNISSVDTAVAVAGGAGPVLDILAAMFDVTNAEVTLTVSVVEGNQLSFRDMETFYIQPTELPFYWTQTAQTAPQSRTIVTQDVELRIRGAR